MTTKPFLLLFLALIHLSKAYDSVVTLDNLSEIGGKVLECPGNPSKTYYQYEGIPYAETVHRFDLAEAKGFFDGVHNGTKAGKTCPQAFGVFGGTIDPDDIDEENCLVVTVSTPVDPNGPSANLPVLIFFYGGIFITGTVRTDWYNPETLVCEDIVVVQIQYRLGTLGFISDGTIIPRNNALKDGRLGLRWTKDNIAAFKGDPDEITLSGQSAGGAMASVYWQSPSTNTLFNKGILHSGNGMNVWSYNNDIAGSFKTVVDNSGCSSDDEIIDQINCLKSKSGADLLTANFNILAFVDIATLKVQSGFTAALFPELETDPDPILTRATYDRVVAGDIPTDYPILISMTNFEGETFAPYVDILRIQPTNKLVPDAFLSANRNTAGIEVKKWYTQNYFYNVAWSFASRVLLSRYTGNVLFDNPTRRFIEMVQPQLAADSTPMYCMQFRYASSVGSFNNAGRVGHLDDMFYLWGLDALQTSPLTNPPYATTVRQQMSRYIANFCKSGNPTPVVDPLLQSVIWQPVTSTSTVSCLNVNTAITHVTNPQQADYQKWKSWYTSYAVPLYTY